MDSQELTSEIIDTMPAGREMDALVAEKVMGWKPHTEGAPWIGDPQWQIVDRGVRIWTRAKLGYGESINNPRYFSPSTDIADAWEMECRIKELGKTNDYVAALRGSFRSQDLWDVFWKCIHASPEERCRAALKVSLKN